MYYIYMLASKRNGTLYVGVTSDLINFRGLKVRGFLNKFTNLQENLNLVYSIGPRKCVITGQLNPVLRKRGFLVIIKRIYQHKNGNHYSFTKRYLVNRLVYYGEIKDINFAITREKRIKAWKREWKIELIEKNNQNWEDLYGSLPIGPEDLGPFEALRSPQVFDSEVAQTRGALEEIEGLSQG